ncbi:hypothetical protein [Halorubrum sp. CSM-61]|uniref:hypothetical protein n=1 Tax=Halorubrum sp. CSM-61 TaxID=2485838 RepID=UPI000F4B18CD|nr:hypothetical protein [Halorubrum sp. CSM-61]
MKEMLYRIFAEIAASISSKIENEFPNSEDLLLYANDRSVGDWKKDQIRGVDLHISERMNLTEMERVLESSDSNEYFVQSCGFDSKDDVDLLSTISSVRNKVMHANRSLVHDRDGIRTVLDTIEIGHSILEDMK